LGKKGATIKKIKTQEEIDHEIMVKGRAGTPALDRLLVNSGESIFSLSRMAMMRATEIYFGSAPLIERGPLEKETTTALREIGEGKVSLKGAGEE